LKWQFSEKIDKISIEEGSFFAMLPKKLLAPGGINLNDASNHKNEKTCTGRDIVKLIYNLHQILSYPSLGMPKQYDNKHKEIKDEEHLLPADRYTFSKSAEIDQKCVDIMISYIPDKDEKIVGWIFWYKIWDPNFDLEVGLERFYTKQKKMSKKEERNEWLYSSVEDYIKNGLHAYAFYGLDSINNPAQAHLILTPERAFKYFTEHTRYGKQNTQTLL
jgi:hypothetical protein